MIKAEELINNRLEYLSGMNIIKTINSFLTSVNIKDKPYIVIDFKKFEPNDIDIDTEDIIWYYTKLGYDVKVNGYSFSVTKNKINYYEYVIISW